MFLSVADLYARRGQTQKELGQLEEYQKRYAKDPDEWLAIQERMAKLFEKAGNATMARRAYEQGLGYARQHASAVKDRGLALVAQAELMDLEPEFAAFDRITLNVTPKYLKAQLQLKAKKLAALEAEYRKIVLRKQAEPAICALHRIGLAYSRFAKALYDNPIPKEVKALGKEGIEMYKSQLAEAGQPLEEKAAEGYQLAVNASRDYGVVNACSREATEGLKKLKPDAVQPSVETVPPIAAVAAADAPQGYGLVASLQAQAAPRPVPGREPVLPALKLRPAGASSTSTPPPPDAVGADPQKRKFDPDKPLPARKKNSGDDEDLLP